tara:strand:+ start:4685 stop:5287 length:603 start_codon:yes stop_codon:yes gene_type:complete
LRHHRPTRSAAVNHRESLVGAQFGRRDFDRLPVIETDAGASTHNPRYNAQHDADSKRPYRPRGSRLASVFVLFTQVASPTAKDHAGQANSDADKYPDLCRFGDGTPLTCHRYERANDRIDPHDHRQPDADAHCCDAMAEAQRADAPAQTHGNDRQDMIKARLLQRMRPGFNEQHRENQRHDQGTRSRSRQPAHAPYENAC